MEKYRNSNASLKPSFPFTNRLLNTGPLYTMCGSSNLQQQQGPQLLMNTTSVGTSTKFQFVPARNYSSYFATTTPTNTTSLSGYLEFNITPMFNTVKTFFSNLLKPKVSADTATTHEATEKRKCTSAPDIYLGIMSDSKNVGDFDKSCFTDAANYKMLAKLSSGTKSFSDHNLSIFPAKGNSPPKLQETKLDVRSSSERKLNEAKETQMESVSVPVVSLPPSPVPIPVPQLHPKKRSPRSTMPNARTKPWAKCTNGKRTMKEKSRKLAKCVKNKKEKDRHELAQKIHEDVETESEAMSEDEWDDPLDPVEPPVKVSSTIIVNFSKDDFPAMPGSKHKMISTNQQPPELPRLSHCFNTLNGKKQRQISECSSEDSFIIFSNDEKLTPSSLESNQSLCDRIRSTLSGGRQRRISEGSEDDFICFELENSDAYCSDDDDDDLDGCDDLETSDSECESEIDVTNLPDSDFDERKVRFNLKPDVHVLRTWNFAYRQARKGEWEQYGRDRVRFRDRIKDLSATLSPILDSNHREKIYCERFLNTDADDVSNSAIEK